MRLQVPLNKMNTRLILPQSRGLTVAILVSHNRQNQGDICDSVLLLKLPLDHSRLPYRAKSV